MSKWNREGLPPVGTHCECTWGWKGLWLECIYHGKLRNGMPIIEEMGGGLMEFESALDNIEFRPLKSEAERKRDESVDLLTDLLFGYVPADLTNLVSRGIAEQIHDAGYRKVNPLSDERLGAEVYKRFTNPDVKAEYFAVGAKWARSQIMGEES